MIHIVNFWVVFLKKSFSLLAHIALKNFRSIEYFGEFVMTLFMRRLLKYGLFFETVLFLLFYYFGPNGLSMISRLGQQKGDVMADIVLIRQEIDQLDIKIKQGKTAFAKEKIARERLLMKKNNETVYFKK